MTKLKLLTAALLAAGTLTAAAPAAHAQQSVLRIGLAEDPDVLDPSRGRTYVGRIVFASLCDKLFDIDDKLNIVPSSPCRTRPRLTASRHDQAASGRQVPRRRADGRRGGAFTLDRHLTCRARSAGPRSPPSTRSRWSIPLTVKLVLKQPFSPLLAQLTDRAGMIVSPKAAREAGERFGSARSAPAPIASSSASSRTVSSSSASPTTGTRTGSPSSASSIARSPTRPCASPTCAPASST